MNRNVIAALIFGSAMIILSWLGANDIVPASILSQDMINTLIIVMPALWIATLNRNIGCSLFKKGKEAA